MVFIIWMLHIIAPNLMMVYELISMSEKTFFKVLVVVGHRTVQTPIIWIQPFVTYITSLSVRENLEELRRILESDKRAETIFYVRKRFLEIRNMINKLDQKMCLVYKRSLIIRFL